MNSPPLVARDALACYTCSHVLSSDLDLRPRSGLIATLAPSALAASHTLTRVLGFDRIRSSASSELRNFVISLYWSGTLASFGGSLRLAYGGPVLLDLKSRGSRRLRRLSISFFFF